MPRWQVPLNGTTVATDLIASDGIARQRKGWTQELATSGDYYSVWRTQFALNGNTRTMAVSSTGTLGYSSGGSLVALFTLSAATVIPRAVYRDQIVYCAQDGITPIALYSGGTATNQTDTFTPTVNTAKVALTTGKTGTVGSYLEVLQQSGAADVQPRVYARISDITSTTNWTVEGLKFSDATARTLSAVDVGKTYPCVPIYSASTGTLAAAGNTFTGVGTRFSTLSLVNGADSLLVLPSGQSARNYSLSYSSDTVLDVTTNVDLADTNYQILRRCPFKDVAVYNESLFGTGVAQYPNRVYIGPPGWNTALPPGFTEPYDPDTFNTTDDPSEYRLFEVDVPAPYDGDHNVALLPIENGVLVLKRFAVHVIRGSYPNFAQQKVADGGGCMDIRSAVTTKAGPFWAGYDGVFTFQGGQVINLMEGRVADEWRALVSGGTTYVVAGETEDHLLVSVTTSGGTYRTYVFDLNNKTWISRFSNMRPKFYWSGRDVGDNPPKCLWVGTNGSGTGVGVANAQPMFTTTGDERDADLVEPAMSFTTGTGITRAPLDQEVRVVDASFTVNVQDSGAAGATVLTPTITHGGGLRQGTSDQTKTLTDISSDTVDRVDRYQYTVGRTGREFYITVTANGSSTTQKVEVHQIALTVRDVGRNRR